MAMKRKMESIIKNWHESSNKALLLYGARQTGKTYVIEKYIESHFSNIVKIDFALQPSAVNYFTGLKDKNDFYMNISLFGDITKENTVVFLDEIQELYKGERKNNTIDIISLTKALSIDNKARYILSGSMLGVIINNIVFNPMGYLEKHRMFPMDFEEYLWANDISPMLIDNLKSLYENKKTVPDAIHEKMLSLFNEYMVVGGMPEIVKNFIENRDISKISELQTSRSNDYKADIIKYAPKAERLLILESYSLVASELNSKNKRFIKTHIDYSNIKNIEMLDKYLWLKDSGIAIPVYNVSEPISPLKITEQRKTLKLFNADIGLLNNELLNIRQKVDFINGDNELNFGAQFENVVAMELNSHGFDELHYYNSKKQGEVDFIIEYKNNAIPIEIKSGKTNELGLFNHNALDNIMNKYEYDNVLIFSNENTKVENDITYFPIYMIMFIENK